MSKNIDYSLSDSFKYMGYWWLPDNPEHRIPGELNYDGGRSITLKLLDTFTEWYSNERFQTEVIHGVTTEGHFCTLLYNAGIGTPATFSKIPGQSEQFSYTFIRQEISSEFLCVGYLFSTVEAVQFLSFGVSYYNLEAWLGESPFSTDYKFEAEMIKSYSISYTPPKIEHIGLSSGIGKLSVQYASVFGSVSEETNAPVLKLEAYLWFDSKQLIHLKSQLDTFLNIERLLTLLMGNVTYPRKMQGVLTIGEEKILVNIFYLREFQLIKPKYQFQMLLPRKGIISQIPTVFDLWLINAETLRHSYNLFFAYLYGDRIYLEFRFLALIQALEAFHRATKGGEYATDLEYEAYYIQIIAAIPDNVTGGWRNALKSRLKYGNQYSLPIPSPK